MRQVAGQAGLFGRTAAPTGPTSRSRGAGSPAISVAARVRSVPRRRLAPFMASARPNPARRDPAGSKPRKPSGWATAGDTHARNTSRKFRTSFYRGRISATSNASAELADSRPVAVLLGDGLAGAAHGSDKMGFAS